MNQDLETILFDEEELAACIARLAGQINEDYAGKSPLVIGILQGSFIFLADLVRKLTLPIDLEFMSVSSYGSSSKSSGKLSIRMDLATDIRGRDVILVEDILDSGNTLSRLRDELQKREPASLRICTLLDKPDRREVEVEVDYRGYAIPDAFVVGYGLDFDQRYRHLPYIGVLKPIIYETPTEKST